MTDHITEQLARLSAMLEQGHLTREEFETQKARLLASAAQAPQPPPGHVHPPVPQQAPGQQWQPPHPGPPGRPPPPRQRKAGYWTGGRIILAVIGIPVLLILILAVVGGGAALTGLLGGPVDPNATILPTPRYEFSDIVVDDTCTSLLDYCVHVSCMVTNVGTANGTPTIEIQLIPEGGTPSATSVSVSVPKGQSTIVTHDFTEARLADGHSGRCIVR